MHQVGCRVGADYGGTTLLYSRPYDTRAGWLEQSGGHVGDSSSKSRARKAMTTPNSEMAVAEWGHLANDEQAREKRWDTDYALTPDLKLKDLIQQGKEDDLESTKRKREGIRSNFN